MSVALADDQSTPITITTGCDIILPVPYYSQPYDNLCWAACCQMILGFYQKMPPGGINTIASKVLNQDCSNLASCNQLAAPEYANTTMGINCKPANFPFTMDAILAELGVGRPIQALLEMDGGTAQHVVLISGFTNQKLVVLDPYYGQAYATYEQLLNSYINGGYWQFTYYQLIA